MTPADNDLSSYCPPELSEGVEALVPLYYAELRKLARRERRRVAPLSTLDTTCVVNEAYLKLANEPLFESAGHFLRVSAIAMRYVLIDRVRAQTAARRGGGQERVEFDGLADQELRIEDDLQALAVHEALARLARFAPRLADVVECRFFGGYEEKETATALGITTRTVRRDWATARAWLKRELGPELNI